jgi:hypothetical protein
MTKQEMRKKKTENRRRERRKVSERLVTVGASFNGGEMRRRQVAEDVS